MREAPCVIHNIVRKGGGEEMPTGETKSQIEAWQIEQQKIEARTLREIIKATGKAAGFEAQFRLYDQVRNASQRTADLPRTGLAASATSVYLHTIFGEDFLVLFELWKSKRGG